jgi:hypothetical protein
MPLHLAQGSSFPGRFICRKAIVSQIVSPFARQQLSTGQATICNVTENILQRDKRNLYAILDNPEADERAASLQDQ